MVWWGEHPHRGRRSFCNCQHTPLYFCSWFCVSLPCFGDRTYQMLVRWPCPAFSPFLLTKGPPSAQLLRDFGAACPVVLSMLSPHTPVPSKCSTPGAHRKLPLTGFLFHCLFLPYNSPHLTQLASFSLSFFSFQGQATAFSSRERPFHLSCASG